MNPWTLELLVVRRQTLLTERRVLARDCSRGLLVRVRPGVYVEAVAFTGLTPEGRHLVAMRALAAVSPEAPMFSHWSAAVLHGLPFLGDQLGRVHVTVQDPAARGLVGVMSHVAPLDSGRSFIGGLHVTDAARTVVDVARTSPFAAGVVIADGALHAGASRAALEEAVAAAGGRRGATRARQAVAFARQEAESAAESISRSTMLEIGIEPPVLQLVVRDADGFAGRVDFGFRNRRTGGEVDGEKKYRRAALAPTGAADAVIAEKWREDRVRRQLEGLARWGYRDAGSAQLLAPILASVGVMPPTARPSLADYCSPFISATF